MSFQLLRLPTEIQALIADQIALLIKEHEHPRHAVPLLLVSRTFTDLLINSVVAKQALPPAVWSDTDCFHSYDGIPAGLSAAHLACEVRRSGTPSRSLASIIRDTSLRYTKWTQSADPPSSQLILTLSRLAVKTLAQWHIIFAGCSPSPATECDFVYSPQPVNILIACICEKRYDLLSHAISREENLAERSEAFGEPAQVASYLGDQRALDMLADSGVDIAWPDRRPRALSRVGLYRGGYESPLTTLAAAGHLRIIEALWPKLVREIGDDSHETYYFAHILDAIAAAAYKYEPDILRYLLDQSKDLFEDAELSKQPLNLALLESARGLHNGRLRQFAQMQMLIDRGARLIMRRRETALHHAYAFGDLNIFRYLFEKFASDVVDTAAPYASGVHCYKQSLIQKAMEHGQVGVLKLLLEKGVGEPCKLSEWLYCAAVAGHTNVVQWYIDSGFSLQADCAEIGGYPKPLETGAKVLGFAVLYGRQEIVRLLLDSGTSVEALATGMGMASIGDFMRIRWTDVMHGRLLSFLQGYGSQLVDMSKINLSVEEAGQSAYQEPERVLAVVLKYEAERRTVTTCATAFCPESR